MAFGGFMIPPPQTALANVLALGAKLEEAVDVARQIGGILATAEGARDGVKILGPNPAPLARVEGEHRIQFLIKSTSRARLVGILRALATECERRGIAPRSVMID